MLEPGTYVMRNDSSKLVAEEYRTMVIGEEGSLFLHPALAGVEHTVLLCALIDGVSMMTNVDDKGTILVPADWMAREYPKTIEFIEKVKDAEGI